MPGRGMSVRVHFLLCFAAKSCEIAIDGTLVLVTACASPSPC